MSVSYCEKAELLIKAMIDFSATAAGLEGTFPLFLLIGAAIKIASPKGPVFYKQERCWVNGRRFKVYKFRTMAPDADQHLDELKDMNEMTGPVFKIKNDPRVIPYVGTFLRKVSLDELPQLINVLKGEMSLVGHRPPIPS